MSSHTLLLTFKSSYALLYKSSSLRKVWTILLICSLVATYYYTNIVVDWEDPSNLTIKYRPLRNILLQQPHYEKFNLINCSEFLTKDAKKAMQNYKEAGRIVLESDESALPHLNMTCEAIRHRVIDPMVKHTAQLGYAISRVVYKDYLWLERSLSDNYSPKNAYCFAVDLKSSDAFTLAILQMDNCFDNVIVVPERFSYDSSGHFINYGHWACTEILLKRDSWEYILWLQNYDMMLRTNQEMSDIIYFMHGHHGIGHKPAQWKRYNIFNNWSAKALNLWKPEAYITEKQRNAPLQMSQNYNEVFLSKELVQYVVENMNYKNFLDSLEQPYRFATDEMFWATLIASADLDLPGQPVGGCQNSQHYITRHNYWLKWFDYDGCESGFSRHGTCIFALEHLFTFSNLPQLVVNKFMPSFDYGLAICYSEVLRKRSRGQLQSPKSLAQTYTGNYTVFC